MTTPPPARPGSDFEQDGPLPVGLTAIEASAGTGKTHALTTLVVRYLAEAAISASQLLVVSFTDSTTADLRARVRRRLVDTAEQLERLLSGADEPSSTDPVVAAIAAAEPEIRLARLQRAISELDSATISTIHGFCSRVLAGRSAEFGSVDSGTDDIIEASIDRMLAVGIDDPTLDIGLDRLVRAVDLRMSMPRAEWFVGDEPTRKPGPKQAQILSITQRLPPLLDEIVAEVRHRRHRTGVRTFDSMITDALELLDGPHGAEVVHALRDRYRVVLIDEFQDTDQVQWEIFDAAFVAPCPGVDQSPIVVIVGDPKQSIYRFRSAELNAYLQAVEAAGDRTMSLRTNWRSDQDLLDALDRLFTGFHFGDERVGFVPVAAPPHRPAVGIDLGARPSPPVQIRFVAGDHRHPYIDSSVARQAVRVDVVATVADLLDGTTRIFDESLPTGDGWRRLECRDIAILTRSNSDAVSIARSLSVAGIPAATASTESVLESDAALQWMTLLRALERPGRSGSARAVALGWFFAIEPADLAAWTDDDHASFHDELHRWSRDLQSDGFPTLLGHIAASGVHERLLRRPTGERDLTDLDHIAELLQTEIGDRRIGAAGLLARLGELASSASHDRVTKDLLARRIDRDDDAVRVMTVHKAKGLEFPVVLVPYMWTTGRSDGLPHAVVDGRRRLDLTWVAGAGDTAINSRLRQTAGDELAGESSRLLYVALTRARHRAVVWWAAPYDGADPLTKKGEPATPRSASSPLAALLRHHIGVVPDRSASLRDLEDTGSIEIVDVEPAPTLDRSIVERVAVTVTDAPGPLAIATYERLLDDDWKIWSFTSLARRLSTGHREVESTTSEPSEVMGGADEATSDREIDDPAETVVEPEAASAPRTPLADAPAGTAFGTAVHKILERADFTADPLIDELEGHCRDVMRYRSLDIEPERLAAGLAYALSVPLGGPVGPMRLTDLGRADRLDEIDFHLPVARTSLRRIGAALFDHLDDHDPLRLWTERLATGANEIDEVALAGWMTGSIDLTFRAGSGADRRYFVADYKTNRLGPRSAYEPDGLVEAMEHHDYPLQATLYLVALHRYLRLRLPGYDPDRDLGGAAYVFVRGMEPESPGHGVMWWRPRPSAIIAVDRLLAGEADR